MPSSMQTNQLLETVINLYLSKEDVLLKNLPFVLDTITSHNLLADPSSEELASLQKKWTVRLNSLLHSKTSTVRWCGISLIKVTCESSHSLLVAHAKGWSAQLLGFLAKPDADIIHKESLETLQFIFTYTHDKPELLRELTAPNMQKFNQLLLQLAQKETLLPSVFSALTANNKYFPSNSRHIADQTLQLCLSCLDGSKDLDDSIILESYKCLSTIYRTGGKSVMAEKWKGHVLKLIGSVHECLNTLFDTVDEETMDIGVPVGYSFSSVDKDYISAFPVLIKRIKLIQDCIGIFLRSSTCVSVSIPVVQLVDLVCRIYNVFEGSLMRDYKERSEFYSLMMCLPALHFSTTKMLSGLLYCTGQEMLRYSKLFSKILLRLLNEYKKNRTMKMSVYKLISLCLEKCGYSFAESLAKPLSIAIIEDLQIVEHKSTGIVMTNQNKGSHKKRKTDVTNSDSISSRLISTSSGDVQIAALQALTSFLNVFGFALENAQRSNIDSIILKRLLQTAPLSNMANEEVTLVKIELYNCLIASVTYPIETQASILPLASRLFTAGINHSAHGLQVVCKKGLTICDLITHARLPPIQRALPKESHVAPTVTASTLEVTVPDESFIPEVIKSTPDESSIPAVITPKEPSPLTAITQKESTVSIKTPEELSKPTVITQKELTPPVFTIKEPVIPEKKTSIPLEEPKTAFNIVETTSKPITVESVDITSTRVKPIDIEPVEIGSNEAEPIELDDEDLTSFDLPEIDMTGPDSDIE